MRIKRPQIGAVFAVSIDSQHRRYFQLIANDQTQLNSDVVRIFQRVYHVSERVEIVDIVADQELCFAHCDSWYGLKVGLWNSIGTTDQIGGIADVVFCQSNSSTWENGRIVIKDWFVWKINQPMTYVPEIKDWTCKVYPGEVFPSDGIVHLIRGGKIPEYYPDFLFCPPFRDAQPT